MTIDCRLEKSKKLRRQFPALLSVNNRIFSIARCHSKQTIFQGLLKDIILVPGADAAVRACPPRPPPYNEMDNRIPMVPESPMRSYWPRGSECTWLDVGNLAFDVYTQKIKVCVNGIWQEVTVETEKRRLDYTLEYQTLTTPSASIDVTVFHLPGEGMFAAFANNGGGEDSSGHSVVFKWIDGKFEFYQKLSTESAQSCEYFQIRNQFFLAVANYGNSTSKQNNSTIFRWHRRRKKFKPYQEILTWTARDFEYFEIDGDHYLAVANHAEGDSNDVESSIYQWNKGKKRFEEKQTIPTIGAYDWTHFTVDGFHFLVVANAFNGLTTLVYSVIYFWQNDQLVQFQTMETNGATDVEWFTIDGDIFLAIANAFNYGPQNYLDKDTQFTNSTIYKLNKDKKIFEKYQSIPTYSAIDWEYFQVGPDHYLIVSNAQNGGSPDQHTSIIYRWQGMEKFVAVHRLITPATADWEIFTDKKDVYLIYANAKDTTSQVLKVKFV
ncbi:hypothetical protein SNE40_022446 [Patella caerulea]|uniref:Uncharacterized protein n=1 Tax=Patella caerulea TaxID=87958 RepID=A0AAN8FWF7_PATCE